MAPQKDTGFLSGILNNKKHTAYLRYAFLYSLGENPVFVLNR